MQDLTRAALRAIRAHRKTNVIVEARGKAAGIEVSEKHAGNDSEPTRPLPGHGGRRRGGAGKALT